MAIKVRVGQTQGVKVPTTSSTSGGTMASLQDTDVSNVANGSVLVFDANTSRWVAVNDLTPGNVKNLDVNGGSF
tara:strand:+ start:330 stop:551 length:222 start_codon:yes stop_codon:yes gene_type:complete